LILVAIELDIGAFVETNTDDLVEVDSDVVVEVGNVVFKVEIVLIQISILERF